MKIKLIIKETTGNKNLEVCDKVSMLFSQNREKRN